jgi:hypothetical protein
VTTHVSASIRTGGPANLARQCDPVGLTSEVGGCARLRPPFGGVPTKWVGPVLTHVVTARGQRFVVEISHPGHGLFFQVRGVLGASALSSTTGRQL